LWRKPGRYDGSDGGFANWWLSVTHHAVVDAERPVAGGSDKLLHESAAQFTNLAQETGVDEAL
jgi:hypothetical protein